MERNILKRWWNRLFHRRRRPEMEVNGTIPNAIGVLTWEGLCRSESMRALHVLRDNSRCVETTMRIKMKQYGEDDLLCFVDLPIESDKALEALIGIAMEEIIEYKKIRKSVWNNK